LSGLSLKNLHDWGKEINKWFYPGVPEFFPAIKKAHPSCTISHNVISVGIKPILTSALGQYMDNIFGYTFFDDLTSTDAIDEIKSTSSSVEKVPALISISYGTDTDDYDFPIKNMVYIGDGQTDVPAFRFVRKRGGLAICVYNPNKEGAFEKAMKLKEHVHYVLPADYTQDKALWSIVNSFIEARSKDPIVNIR
jgi:predicted HAD superfamily phosphohydrolase